jgi:ribosomal protein L19E
MSNVIAELSDRIESLEGETLLEKRAGGDNLERWIDRAHEVRCLRQELEELQREDRVESTMIYRATKFGVFRVRA